MFLKSMEIFGFKSFADRTRVDFESGITVVVGPNGCGKSNIVDSAKWVLGEKKAKNIRGDKMEDVIFTGTENRKPLSLAEVSLTLDNANRILDFDSDSVTVTRRVFRDGESEYLINKSPVRLKDISKLFMDTGIGKTSYSVMEQGRIDMILSSRAEDRRYIFEEAAGISKFKLQKKESLKKLTDTSENLERINDIISEIEREKDIKAKQAEKTKVYLSLRDELKINDVKINVLKFKDLNKKNLKLIEIIDKLKKDRETLSKRISVISEANERDEKRKNEIQLELFELDKKLHTYRIKVEGIDGKTEENKKLIAEQEKRREKLRNERSERKRSYDNLVEEKLRNTKNGEEIIKKIEQDRQQLKNYFESRKRKIESIHAFRDNIEKNKSLIKEKEEKLKTLRSDLEVVIKQLIDAIEKRKAELIESEGERLDVKENISSILKNLDEIVQQAIQNLNINMPEESSRLLKQINVTELKDLIEKFESFENGFRDILFDKAGIHAQKEELDKKISAKVTNIEQLRQDNTTIEENIRTAQAELEDINEMITRIEKDLSRNDNEKTWIEKHLQSLNRQISDIQNHIDNLDQEIKRSEEKTTQLLNDIKECENRLSEFNQRSKVLKEKIDNSTQKRDDIDTKMVGRKETSQKDTENLRKIDLRITEREKTLVEVKFRINNIEEYLWTEYEKKIDDIKKVKVDELETSAITEQIQKLKSKIQSLGPINNLAIEEFKDLKKRFEYYNNQRKDIEKAREDIMSVIEEINSTSVNMFIDTFKQIQKNFSENFKQLFDGGSAEMEIVDFDNVLDSGIDIMVRPPGKKPKSINLLSGGERTMTAIALLFSTYMVKPSPFCFLDEIDAALDEENVGRFLKMLKKFAQKTQFIMISHNKKTMSIGTSLYGITMEERGVSKVLSVKLDKSQSGNQQ